MLRRVMLKCEKCNQPTGLCPEALITARCRVCGNTTFFRIDPKNLNKLEPRIRSGLGWYQKLYKMKNGITQGGPCCGK